MMDSRAVPTFPFSSSKAQAMLAAEAVRAVVSRALETGAVEAGFVECEGARLAFDVLVPRLTPEPSPEPQARRLLLLVNGYQRTRADFRAFRKRLAVLAPHLVTVSLDNRGCGETVLTDVINHPLTLDRLAQDAGALGAAVASVVTNPSAEANTGGLAPSSAKFAVLGISMGGMVAQILAARCQSVSACVLVSTTAGGHGRIWPDHIDPKEQRAYRQWPTDEAGMKRKMARYFGPRFLARSPLLVDMMVKNMLKAQRGEAVLGGEADSSSGHPNGSRLQFEAAANFDGTGLLADINCPTLVVTGDKDFIIPQENADYLLSRLPQAILVRYAEAGHLVLVEEPERFVVDVANFLG